MPRFTLYYDGDKPEAAAADAERVRQQPDLEIIATQPGVLLLSASRESLQQAMQHLSGWIASEEQCATQPQPPRPALKPPKRKKQ